MSAGGPWSNQIVNKLVVAGPNGGVFEYAPTTPNPSSTPGLNNLVASVTAQAGTDATGLNATLAGFTTYVWNGTFSLWFAVSHQVDGLYYFFASTEAGPWTQITRMATVSRLGTPATYLLNIGDGSSGVVVNIQNPLHQGIEAVHPGSVPEAAETWQALSLLNGWAQTSSALSHYRLSVENMVEFVGALNGGAATGVNIASLPSSYRPATAQQWPCGCTTGVNAGASAFLNLSTGGTLFVSGITVGTAAQSITLNGRVSLGAPSSP